MPDLSTLALFSAAALTLIVVPGPAVLYIVAQSVHHGRLPGVVATAGIATGGLVHVAAATIGLSSLLLSSATAFQAVKFAGAAYLVILGLRRLRGRRATGGETQARVPRSRRRLYGQGVVVNILNPKTALFFLALLPQFVDPNAGSAAVQMLVLGLVWVVLAFVCDAGWALAAGSAGDWIRSNARFLRGERYVSGTVLVGVGAATALAKR
jgi:threonine/homoserine/homoserine lactone efflux protein